MLSYDGFRIIKITGGQANGYVVENGIVDYEPVVKYRVEKQNAFDPTIIIRREPYHEDSIDCEAILLPIEFDNLVEHLTGADQLYIEFNTADAKLQFPIITDKLPKLEDDTRSFTNKVKFSFKSIYQSLSYINFNDIFGWGTGWGKNWGF